MLLIFCLVFCLVCSEIPEMFELCDDTSNDLVGSPSSPRLGALRITPQISISPRCGALADVAFRNLAVISSAELVVPCGPELLRLLSIQRK